MDFKKKHNELMKNIDELNEKKRMYYEAIKEIDKKIEQHQERIYDNCIDCFGNHDWIQYREEGMYGEVFYVCKNCECSY